MAEADTEKLTSAQRAIGMAMGACMALSWAPFVGGILSGLAQAKLVSSILHTLGRKDDGKTVETVLWFFNKKTLYLSVATYAPTIGPAIQVLLTYALGQLVLRCATDDALEDITFDALERRWIEIQEDIFSGEKVIAFYEKVTGKEFPKPFRPRIVMAVDWVSAAYRRAERLPGVTKSQDALGDALQRGAQMFAARVATLARKLRRKKNL
jgi:hypothetical protein